MEAPGASRPTLLVVDDDVHLAEQLRWALKDVYDVALASDRVLAVDALSTSPPDLVLLDLRLPPGQTPDEGFRVLGEARRRPDPPLVIMMTGEADRELALRAMAEGAYDYFLKPVDLDTLRVVVARACERQALERENARLREQLRARFRVDGLVGTSPAMQRVLDAVRRVADSAVTVYLEGESGTGKEVVARSLHFSGSRRDRPFVAVHCAALPETLLEAELFGHEKGAFTGADASRVGRFEAADGGTLFLDEIACLGPASQVKLLRVLEERVVERLGSNRPRRIDIRLIAATNENLDARIRSGLFREDLFFRLHVFPVRLPPLRERQEDIPLLAEFFLRRAKEEPGGRPKRLSAELKSALTRYSWKGNVRELRNLIETLALLTDGEVIGVEHLPAGFEASSGGAGIDSRVGPVRRAGAPGDPPVPALPMPLKDAVEDFERRLLVDAIRRGDGVKARAARELGLDPSQMKYLVRKHGL